MSDHVSWEHQQALVLAELSRLSVGIEGIRQDMRSMADAHLESIAEERRERQRADAELRERLATIDKTITTELAVQNTKIGMIAFVASTVTAAAIKLLSKIF